MTTPIKLGGKEFERLVMFRARYDERACLYTVGRYGVKASPFSRGNGLSWRPSKSLPDFEGVLLGGRQFIFDCKTCSQTSYDLTGSTHKSFEHQYKHLKKRAEFGALTFLLLHFNEKVLKRGTYPAETHLIPVMVNGVLEGLWAGYENGTIRHIGREMPGITIAWDLPTNYRGSVETPNIYAALQFLQSQSSSRGL